MRKGYDFFTPDPGVEEMECKVCGTTCDVERDVMGPRSWAGAMAKIKTLHDSFSCPHGEEEWHKRALKLLENLEEYPSPTLKKIMLDDFNKMIKEGLEL